MIDLVTMTSTISEDDTERIVGQNNLKTNTKDGVVYFDNEKEKFKHGYYMRIETKGAINRIKLECSLHKFYCYQTTGRQVNWSMFTFSNAIAAVDMLKDITGLPIERMKVTYYEVGANLYMSKDCKVYIDNLQSIGDATNTRTMFVNPRYKGERIRTTVFHRHMKKIYKIYDKVFEMKDKARTDYPADIPYILRVESTLRRVEDLTVADLFASRTKIADRFLRDWRTAQFEPTISAPKGTHQRKVDLCAEIIKHGREQVLNTAKEDYKNGKLTDRRFRDIREFVTHEWDAFKNSIQILKSPEEVEFRQRLNDAVNMLKH
jgi:hypothetical protein